ncbi:MAG: hypothetical protein DRQ10_00300 [Candidatus Hydrothermota bacterium]|nr:MAG: hypothetical protein DRQ10_00300 [Candidatus Hydrothermae bacterium]
MISEDLRKNLKELGKRIPGSVVLVVGEMESGFVLAGYSLSDSIDHEEFSPIIREALSVINEYRDMRGKEVLGNVHDVMIAFQKLMLWIWPLKEQYFFGIALDEKKTIPALAAAIVKKKLPDFEAILP